MPQISDEAVFKATGRNWHEWFEWLGKQGAKDKTHAEIVILLRVHNVSHWYAQTITGEFEKQFKGRDCHEMPDGFQSSVSATVPLSKKKLENLFLSRKGWPEGNLVISTHNPGKNVRGAWSGPHGGRLAVSFEKKDTGKSRIAINHAQLVDAMDCEAMKTAWRKYLSAIKSGDIS